MYVVRKRTGRSVERIQHEMEDLFHSLVSTGRPIQVRITSGATTAWRPPIEVYETDDALVVLAELAGLSEDQIEVIIEDRLMTIRGERVPVPTERRTVHTMGILYGPFAADVYLPCSVDENAVEATYEAGMLRVRLPHAVGTRIPVATDSDGGSGR